MRIARIVSGLAGKRNTHCWNISALHLVGVRQPTAHAPTLQVAIETSYSRRLCDIPERQAVRRHATQRPHLRARPQGRPRLPQQARRQHHWLVLARRRAGEVSFQTFPREVSNGQCHAFFKRGL